MTRHDEAFINPYTFVPFPSAGGVKAEPAGHDRLGPGHYSGRITVSGTARTAIMVRGSVENDEPVLPWHPGANGTRQAIVPGSGLAGAVRSLHETLAGGCLRVFDHEFLPTYRDMASRNSFDRLVMALVTEVDGKGRPLAMILCTDVVWTDAVDLQRVVREPLHTGMVLDIDERDMTAIGTDWGRERVGIEAATPRSDPVEGAWLVLVADAGAREQDEVFRIALARLPDGPESVSVDDQAWTDYERCALDAEDMRQQRKDQGRLDALRLKETGYSTGQALTELMKDVRWNDHDIGRRQLVRPWARPGTVLWVRRKDGEITDLRPAVLWRHSGQRPAGERVPESLRACRYPRDLCPSCRIFGSVDAQRREEDDKARQCSYAGHVRFTDLVAAKCAPTDGPVRPLAPLSSPRSGSGQFYLDNGNSVLPQRDNEVLREWGGSADSRQPRQLRGRKYYWSTRPAKQHPRRSDKRKHHSDEMVTSARVFEHQQRFDTTVCFDGLTLPELGGLLAALQPALLLTPASSHRDPAVCLPIGGGKPFGFGALETRLTLDRIDSAGSRYGEEEPPDVTIEQAVEQFRTSIPEGIRDTVWPALSAVLTLDHVDPDHVWYPPGASWNEHHTGRPDALESFDRGYEFWKTSRGQRMRKEPDRPLVPLPDAAAGADQQYLKIVPAPKEKGAR